MSVILADECLQTARLSAAELLQEVAVMLFAQQRLTLGQASHLAGMGQYRFQHLLASQALPRGVPIRLDSRS